MFKYLLNSFVQVFNLYIYIYIVHTHVPYIHILIMYYLMKESMHLVILKLIYCFNYKLINIRVESNSKIFVNMQVDGFRHKLYQKYI
jgi:hypothetical protein